MSKHLFETNEQTRWLFEQFKSAVETVFQNGASFMLAHVNNVTTMYKGGVYTLVVFVDSSTYATELMGRADLVRLHMSEEGFEEMEVLVSRGRAKDCHPYLIEQIRIASEGIKVNWEFSQALKKTFPDRAPSILKHVNNAYVFVFENAATLFVFVDEQMVVSDLEPLGAKIIPYVSIRGDSRYKSIKHFKVYVSEGEYARHYPFEVKDEAKVNISDVLESPIASFEESPYSTMTFNSFDKGIRNSVGFFMAYEFCLQRNNAWHNPTLSIKELFLFGEHGSGKTHLLHAIESKIKELKPDTRVLCVSGKDLLQAILGNLGSSYLGQKASLSEDMSLLKEVSLSDVLLIDDVEPGLIGSRAVVDALEQKLRLFICEGGSIVITSSCPPEAFGFGDNLEPLFRRKVVVELFNEKE